MKPLDNRTSRKSDKSLNVMTLRPVTCLLSEEGAAPRTAFQCRYSICRATVVPPVHADGK